MNTVVPHQQKIGFSCPHCKGPMRTRSSRGVTDTYRQSIVACLDPECGATYGLGHEINHQISPSAKPNPGIMIRTSPPRTSRAESAPANDDASDPEVSQAPANDDGPPSAVDVATGT